MTTTLMAGYIMLTFAATHYGHSGQGVSAQDVVGDVLIAGRYDTLKDCEEALAQTPNPELGYCVPVNH
jgi:hypothetical protein